MQIRLSAGADSLICCASAGSTSIPHITVAQALPSEAEFAARIAESSRDDHCLAREENGQVFGFTHAHRPAERAAYQRDAEPRPPRPIRDIPQEQTALCRSNGASLFDRSRQIIRPVPGRW